MLIKQYTLIFSIISTILGTLTLVVNFSLNIPYYSIDKSFGIKKNGKKETMSFIVLTIVMFILGLIIFGILFYTKTSNGENSTKQLSLWYVTPMIIIYALFIYKSYKFDKYAITFINKNLKISNPKCYCAASYIVLVASIGINSFMFISYIFSNKVDNYNSYWLLINMFTNYIATIFVYGIFQAEHRLLSLQQRNIYLKDSSIIINCKIVYDTDKYICVYKNNRIIHINSHEILKIESYSL